MSHDDKTVVTLREIAELIGISVDAARRRAKRRDKDGVWRILPSNHPQDPLRIELPRSDLNSSERPRVTSSGRQEVNHPESAPSERVDSQRPVRHEDDPEAISGIVAKFTDQLNGLTTQLLVSERERAEARSNLEIAKNEVAHLREQIEATMSLHRSELNRQNSVSERERALANCEIELLKQTLAEMRNRSWWRRLVG